MALLQSSRDRSGITYKGTLFLKKKSILGVTNLGANFFDNVLELLNKRVEIKLISSTLIEPALGTGKVSQAGKIQPWISGSSLLARDVVQYNIEFQVDAYFGVPGAFVIRNNHVNEFYLLSLKLNMPGNKSVDFPCNSWVYPATKYQTDRIFFSNELCLPSDTPPGLVAARKSDLKALQGNGTGRRVESDRIYDYDVYNDLGADRKTLGGNQNFPYPRRCRTGRTTLNGVEDRTLNLPLIRSFYVPADEVFPSLKNSGFIGGLLKGILHSVIPKLIAQIPCNESFHSFKEVDMLYDQGMDVSKLVTLPLQKIGAFGFKSPLELVNTVIGTSNNSSLLKFPKPQVIQANKTGWMSDEEFGRQMLSGVNPSVIECLKKFPPTSKLPNSTSALLEDHISSQLEGKPVQQALDQNKLFILNYYDFYMPYVERMNALPNTFVYASRTILFLKSDGTLKPVAIELSLPSTYQKVFTPPISSRSIDWTWELAKAHVLSNDAGYHQLISHWLKTHCCIEPFIIATKRQLSSLHPLNPFLLPHFKHTMAINSQARHILINSGGVIEGSFNAGKYAMESSSLAYRDWKLFDEGLPVNLVKRGIAVRDPNAKHGLKLIIEDYPYANDGLEIWAALEKWTRDYVNIIYRDDQKVVNDSELQAWWNEVINYGHADKSKETWWGGNMNTKGKLVQTLTTIIWLGSAQHAAVNFGQYAYAGYMPNHPTRTHRAIPDINQPEYQKLKMSGERWYLSAVSRKAEAIKAMIAFEMLSTHADDEEYLGQRSIHNWTANEHALSAFRSFSQQMKEVDSIVASRNNDPKLKNRRGPVQVPYTLLQPDSDNGLTGRGVPNSISI